MDDPWKTLLKDTARFRGVLKRPGFALICDRYPGMAIGAKQRHL